MQAATDNHAYWHRELPALLGELRTTDRGLSTADARARMQSVGANTLTEFATRSALRLLAHQFASPLVLILVAGAAISLFLRDWIDAAIILVIVVGSALLGFLQEYRASTAIAELRQRLALTARTWRDGVLATIAARDLVPGDVVVLAAGNLVPADGRVLDARDFLVSEASLTGESFPVAKAPGTLSADAPLAARTNCVFLGTSVRSGTATVLITQTGRGTVFGTIAENIATRPPETEFARGVRDFGYLLVRVMIVMVLFVLTVNHVLGRPAIESLLFAIALAVGLSPELLPAIVSVTLARGARTMAQRGVLVRRLEAIENLGSINVFCTDKTGTLTCGNIVLDAAVDAEGAPSPEVLQLAFLNAALESGIDNPLDAAIVAAGERSKLSVEGARKIDEMPYDFQRKRLSIVVAPSGDDDPLLVTKGACPNVLVLCTSLRRGPRVVPMDEASRAALDAYWQRLGSDGVRVLALATRRMDARPRYDHTDEAALTLEGFLLFRDPPKPTAARAIRDLEALGIRVKVITGDNRHVAAHVARELGVASPQLLAGDEIARMKDEALWHRARHTDLFVEVDPQQKERIVRALQHTGHAVGYLGDGINDAPALHAADVGISVDGATDAARESADVILVSSDLDVLRRGIEDGRRTFANTLKYIAITTSANFGNMVSMAIAAPLLPFLPLAAKQILLNNFLSDLPSMALSTDRVDPQRIAQAQRWNVHAVRRFMLVFGLLSTLFDLLTFVVLLRFFGADETTFQTAWFVVSLLTELAVLLVLRTDLPLGASAPGGMLLWTTLGVAVVALAAPYLGPPARMFGFVALDPELLGAMVAIVAAYVLATEFAKRRYVTRLAGHRRKRVPAA